MRALATRGFALVALLASGAAWAQPRLAFDAPRHDFGTFDEGETVTHVFAFTNEGDQPLVIANVTAACGCTTPDWTTEPVAPGRSGQITVAYDSEGRPGPFEKTVRVDAEAGGAVTLRIVGNVTSVFVARGVTMGGLTFATDHLEVGDHPASERLQAVFRFQNTGDRPVRIESVRLGAETGEAVFPTRPVFPGDVAAVLVNVEDPSGLGASFEVPVSVITDDQVQPEKSLRISGSLGR